MQRFLIILALIALACQVLTPVSVSTPVPSPLEPSPSPSLTPSPSPSPLPSPSSSPSPTVSPSPSPSPSSSPVEEQAFTVHYHPDGPLFVGDQVSLEVIAPQDTELDDKKVQVELGGEREETLGSSEFEPFGIGGRFQATFRWAWDTRGLESGAYDLHFTIQPDGLSWTETVQLFPEQAAPPPEPDARWEMVESECCVIHYITGTEAERDLEELMEIADAEARKAVRQMGVEFTDPIPITLLPRVLGHGGFASDEIYISYLDRNYAGNDFALVLHHEMIHILDKRLGGELRPSLLVEGLAVYLTGGHFKKEPLLSRTAALLDLDQYLPLAPLADDFYKSQHEIGYLEGGAFIQYLVDRFGWEAFSDFYRDIHPHESGKESQAIDVALQEHFDLSLAELESQFIEDLDGMLFEPYLYDDVRLTVAYYDTVRRYQQLMDPSAYFLTAWLPSGEELRERGIVADYLRRPNEPVNIDLETRLVEADQLLRARNFREAERVLKSVNASLDAIEAGEPLPLPLP